jgi:hypothetical protein
MGDGGWIVLDEWRNDSQLNGGNFAATFEIATRLRIRIF